MVGTHPIPQIAVGTRGIRPAGLSLVELLVALAIGLVVVAGIVQVYLSARQAYRTTEALARVQETGRLALTFLARDIRLAGYAGCADPDSIRVNNIVDLDGDGSADSEYTLSGSNTLRIDDDPTSGPGVTGADRITILYAVPQITHVASVTNPTTGTTATGGGATISLNENPYGYQSGDVLVITDCEQADIFVASTVSTTSPVNIRIAANNVSNKLSKDYNPSQAVVMAVRSRRYYVGDTGRRDEHGKPVYALYRQDNSDPAVELVDGIRDIAFTAGEDTDGDGSVDRYVSPSSADPDKVVAVGIEVWVQSPQDNVVEQPRKLAFEGKTDVDPGNRRLNVVFTTTVSLRNRLP